MGRTTTPEHHRRVRAAVAAIEKAARTGGMATVMDVQAATGASYNCAKRLREEAFAFLTFFAVRPSEQDLDVVVQHVLGHLGGIIGNVELLANGLAGDWLRGRSAP